MTYSYSFSGTDVKAFAERDSNVFSLNSLATISFQVNEQKSPVRRLGRQGVVGFTRSIKTIAGTMVFVILKDHPLRELMPNNNLALRHKEVSLNMPHQATNILPFNLRLKYKTEHSDYNFSELFIEGIEIISQSIVTSVNDMVTELIVQFMGRDYKEFYNSNNDRENYLASLITEDDLNNDLQLQEQYDNEQLLNKENIAFAENDTVNYYIDNMSKMLLKIKERQHYFDQNNLISNAEIDNYYDKSNKEYNDFINMVGNDAQAQQENYVSDLYEKDRTSKDKKYIENLLNELSSSRRQQQSLFKVNRQNKLNKEIKQLDQEIAILNGMLNQIKEFIKQDNNNYNLLSPGYNSNYYDNLLLSNNTNSYSSLIPYPEAIRNEIETTIRDKQTQRSIVFSLLKKDDN